MKAAAVLAAAAARFARPAADAEILRAGRRVLLDWIGCAIAGSPTAVAGIARAGGLPSGPCRVLGTARRTMIPHAVRANAAAGHALDFDDELLAFEGHPAATIVPAVLAVAEQHGSSLAETVNAIAAGYEAAGLLGSAANPEHYDAGWHATATLGAIATATAVSRLLGADVPTAVGLAAVTASGRRRVFGTAGKALQVAAAAAAGTTAAIQAAAGAVVPDDTLDEWLSAVGAVRPLDDGAASCPAILSAAFKRHAACGAAQSAIEAAGRAGADIAVADIDHIVVRVSAATAGIAHIGDPSTPEEAQFSLRHLVAVAVQDEAPLMPSVLRNPAAHDELRARTRLVVDEASFPRGGHPASVRIVAADGRVSETTVLSARGSAAHPLSDVEVAEKFFSLVAPIRGEAVADEMHRRIRSADPASRTGGLLG